MTGFQSHFYSNLGRNLGQWLWASFLSCNRKWVRGLPASSLDCSLHTEVLPVRRATLTYPCTWQLHSRILEAGTASPQSSIEIPQTPSRGAWLGQTGSSLLLAHSGDNSIFLLRPNVSGRCQNTSQQSFLPTDGPLKGGKSVEPFTLSVVKASGPNPGGWSLKQPCLLTPVCYTNTSFSMCAKEEKKFRSTTARPPSSPSAWNCGSLKGTVLAESTQAPCFYTRRCPPESAS